jgi:folate-binding protein YgfZ
MRSIAEQYRILADGAGWRIKRERGRLEFSGKDRLSFLQALLTNDVATLSAGQSIYAAWLTPQGRMICDVRLFATDDQLIADVPVADADKLASAFDRLIFAEDVTVRNVTAETTQVTLVGNEVGKKAGSGLVFSENESRSGLSTGDLIVSRDREAETIETLERAGFVPISDALWEAMRIDAGRPAFGIDMDSDTIPLEAGLLDRAISTTKGCYVGQEIIIRVLHRGGGRVARRLVKMQFPPDPAGRLAPGATIRAGERDTGKLTSTAPSLDDRATIALGYVHRDDAEPGRTIDAAGMTGTITALGG